MEDDRLLAAHLHQHLRKRGFDVTLWDGAPGTDAPQQWQGST